MEFYNQANERLIWISAIYNVFNQSIVFLDCYLSFHEKLEKCDSDKSLSNL